MISSVGIEQTHYLLSAVLLMWHTEQQDQTFWWWMVFVEGSKDMASRYVALRAQVILCIIEQEGRRIEGVSHFAGDQQRQTSIKQMNGIPVSHAVFRHPVFRQRVWCRWARRQRKTWRSRSSVLVEEAAEQAHAVSFCSFLGRSAEQVGLTWIRGHTILKIGQDITL